MKTQINNLRSGSKNQITNELVDYSQLPKATSHVGHAGDNYETVDAVWQKVTAEHPEKMEVLVDGLYLELTANWSLSRKSVSYSAILTEEQLKGFLLMPSKNKTASLSISFGNTITVSNGKKSYIHLCPSLIEIL